MQDTWKGFYLEGVKREPATRGEIAVQSVHVLAGLTSIIVIT